MLSGPQNLTSAQWMSFCDAYSGTKYHLSRIMQSMNEDTYTPAIEEARGLMAGWEPTLQERYFNVFSVNRVLLDRMRERARAKFESDDLCLSDDPYHSDSE